MTTRTRAVRRATSIAAAVAVGLAPLAVDAAPARAVPQQQQQETAAPQRLHLGGVYDARTFANYTADDDGHPLNDRVIRSGDLNGLDDAGLAELQRRRVTVVVDLRSSVEAQVKPNRPVPGARLVKADVMALAPLAGAADFPGMYRTFVDNPGAREAYRTTLLEVAAAGRRGDSILIHCSAGRDRTGWAAAVLLRIAGVDMPTIEADFLAGNNGTDIAWLRGAFAHADRIFGSFDGYLHTGLRLTDADITAVRTALR